MCELINKQCIEMSKYVYSKNVFVIIIKRVCTSTAVFWICGKLSKQITHAIRSTNTLTLLTCFSNWKTIMNKRARLWIYVWVCSIYKRKRHGNKVDVCMEKIYALNVASWFNNWKCVIYVLRLSSTFA